MKASTKIGGVLMICYLVAWLDRMAINMAMPFMSKDLGFAFHRRTRPSPPAPEDCKSPHG